MLLCRLFGGERRIISQIDVGPVARKILAHLGLPTRLPGLNCVLIEDDAQGFKPRVFDRRADWRDRCGDLPIAMTCTVAELAEGLDTSSLPGGVHYMTWGASVAEANALMERVWSYRAPRELWAVRTS